MEVIDGEDDGLVARQEIEGDDGSKTSVLVPVSNNRVVFAAGLVCRSCGPIANE